MLIQSCFDLAKLDSVSTFLDHSIAAAEVDVITRLVLNDNVSGFIPALAGGIDEKGICRPFRKVPIPLHDARTSCNQFSSLAALNFSAVFVYNPDLVMRTSDSYWKRFSLIHWDRRRNLKICTNVGLRWSV